MPINAIKKDIKRHRPVDWFAILILISAALIIINILLVQVGEFSEYMDSQFQQAQADILDRR